MQKTFIIIGIILILVSFCFLVLSLMNIFPKWLSIPALLGSILFTVNLINQRHRFKGIKRFNGLR
ncbi:hypothetical protein [Alteribacter populi]|uniref:hypothetical protein n=1 Tax=Alteribacter populi TaxID=2011011 RepID=UPI0012FD3C34|nr:hypothetical protein [Alteribacter populi]